MINDGKLMDVGKVVDYYIDSKFIDNGRMTVEEYKDLITVFVVEMNKAIKTSIKVHNTFNL